MLQLDDPWTASVNNIMSYHLPWLQSNYGSQSSYWQNYRTQLLPPKLYIISNWRVPALRSLEESLIQTVEVPLISEHIVWLVMNEQAPSTKTRKWKPYVDKLFWNLCVCIKFRRVDLIVSEKLVQWCKTFIKRIQISAIFQCREWKHPFLRKTEMWLLLCTLYNCTL